MPISVYDVKVITVFKDIPKCKKCGKDIEGNEEVVVTMRYQDRRGMTEIRAFIQNEGQIICMKCYEK